VPQVTDVASGYVRVDAGSGFAQPALAAACAAGGKARSAGIAVLAIHNSHFAALWPDVEPFADEGLVALSVVNSMTCVVPHGARKPLFGTNPIAFAAPCAGHDPIVSTWPPAPWPTATCRLPRVPASSCLKAWAWMPMAAHHRPQGHSGRRRAAAVWRAQGLGAVDDGRAAGGGADRWHLRVRLVRHPGRKRRGPGS
jgi:hypothetical protein